MCRWLIIVSFEIIGRRCGTDTGRAEKKKKKLKTWNDRYMLITISCIRYYNNYCSRYAISTRRCTVLLTRTCYYIWYYIYTIILTVVYQYVSIGKYIYNSTLRLTHCSQVLKQYIHIRVSAIILHVVSWAPWTTFLPVYDIISITQ